MTDQITWVSDPNDPHVIHAMKHRCEVCDAKPGRPCWNIIDANEPLPGRIIHFARLPHNNAA